MIRNDVNLRPYTMPSPIFTVLCLICLLVSSADCTFGQKARRDVPQKSPSATAADLASQGHRLSQENAEKLEAKLKTDPEDLSARTQLLGYYFSTSIRVSGPEVTLEARRRHILWLIQHHPQAEIAGMSDVTIDPAGHALADRSGYEQAKGLWLKQIELHRDNPSVLKHSAKFFKLPDKAIAESILKRGQALEPHNREWTEQLAELYANAVLGLNGRNQNGFPTSFDSAEANGLFAKKAMVELDKSTDPELVKEAALLVYGFGMMLKAMDSTGGFKVDYENICRHLFERALELDPKNFERAGLLSSLYYRQAHLHPPKTIAADAKRFLEQQEIILKKSPKRIEALLALSKFAFAANEMKKAEMYGRRTLDLIQAGTTHKDVEQIYHVNLMLGRIALRLGDMERAKQYLIGAGTIHKNTPFEKYHTPGMALASEMLEKGEREAVLEYLDLCAISWDAKVLLKEWKATIQAGGRPNFPVRLLEY